MATTPEGPVKTAIKKVLDPYKPDLWYDMPVPSGYGKSSLDFVGFFLGEGFAIEAKAPGKVPTSRQENTIEDIAASGAKVFVIDGDTTELEKWLRIQKLLQ